MKKSSTEWTNNPWPAIAIGMLVLMVFIAGSCTTLGSVLAGAPAASVPLVTANPDATATPTAFAPLPPTETPPPPPPGTATPIASPTPINPWGDYPAPVEPSAIEIRRPVAELPVSKETVNIIIMGSDQRPYSYGNNTDVMMLVSLDPKAGTAKLLSFPRDLYVFIPGWRVDRINVADAVGGPEAVAQTIRYNFGLDVDHWMLLYFWDFTNIIDSLGGVDVAVGGPLYDECGGIHWNYGPGTYHMDGFTALCYVRMRKNSGDFDRLRRQQEVVLAVFQRMLTLDGLAKVPELYDQFKGMIETDMSLNDILPLVPLGTKLAADSGRIQRLAITADMGELWRVPYSGASVVLPRWDLIDAMLNEAFPK